MSLPQKIKYDNPDFMVSWERKFNELIDYLAEKEEKKIKTSEDFKWKFYEDE